MITRTDFYTLVHLIVLSTVIITGSLIAVIFFAFLKQWIPFAACAFVLIVGEVYYIRIGREFLQALEELDVREGGHRCAKLND